MKLYAQQGYGTGSGGNNKILAGLERGFINGAILSPKDYSVERAIELLDRMADEHAAADRLFDPQFYASLIAHDPRARMGKLLDEYPYFSAARRSQLESESVIRECLHACLEFQQKLNVSAVIAPNIIIRRSLDSIEAAISKNFIRSASDVWREVGDERPLYATLAIEDDALQDRHELDAFLADITVMDGALGGFYILVASPTSEIQPELIDYRTLGGWMLLNHSLSLNGFDVINGFSDILTPFLCAAGGVAGATGWWANLKVFSMDRFEPPSPGGRRPIARYLSSSLLNSIRFDELERLRRRFPEVVNGLESDGFYSEDDGSEPAGQLQEILQTWDTITSFAGVDYQPELSECLEWVQDAEELYFRINSSPAMRLAARSDDSHLERIGEGIRLFAQLAEIDL